MATLRQADCDRTRSGAMRGRRCSGHVSRAGRSLPARGSRVHPGPDNSCPAGDSVDCPPPERGTSDGGGGA